ncbi:MAG: hypothetical protein LRY66_07715 [Saccharospirillaceae bacterium]|nr:hypothetical protein [Saccharospirillaceae bacterium]MCD8531237.1 hypothetical protein [Saccharospirillaceae bacterium]
MTIELSWQGEADVGLWLGAPSGEIIRSTHPVGESLPVWLEMAETMSADAVRQRLHLEYQLAEGQYQIAVQHLFSRSDIHYQVIMRQGNRLLRSARGYFARSAEWTVVVQRLWMLGADEAWNRALPLPLLREQFQGGWQLHTASGATVSVGIQEDTAELWIQEGSDCQQHIIKDAFTLPGAMRWQNGQLWLHPVFYNDLLYSVAQDREFLPLQQAPLESISCTPEHP